MLTVDENGLSEFKNRLGRYNPTVSCDLVFATKRSTPFYYFKRGLRQEMTITAHVITLNRIYFSFMFLIII